MHELQTVFQFLDYCDDIEIRTRNDTRIVRSGGVDIPPARDLSVRAARLLQERCARTAGADLIITKRIPTGGGLGGGSSDAATVLIALNEQWNCGAPQSELRAWGLELGADVPVFIEGIAAFAQGVGERLEPFEADAALPEDYYVLLQPSCSISTREIFEAPELTRNSAPITIRDFLKSGGHNDCTAAVRGRYPQVGEALDWLAQFGEARLTGTGACVFLNVDSLERAREILRAKPDKFEGFLARGLNESPLRRALSAHRAERNGWGVAKR